jgi:glucose/arabinose dehydrogenase
MRLILPSVLAICVATLPANPLAAADTLRLVPAWPKIAMQRPLWVGAMPGATGTLAIAEQGGRLVAASDDPSAETVRTLLDLTARVRTNPTGYSEEGLLSVAFHHAFATDRRLFVWWCPKDGERRTRLSEFTCAADGIADPASERVLLEVAQPFANHNGGDLAFGPDRMLYLSLGDGGSAGDPQDHGQRLDSLLGKILRLDVSVPGRATAPADNPFIGQDGKRPEIWAYGLRNVWRMSFDAAGRLWAADVGQNAREEIDLIVRGGNYGWRLREGTKPYKGGASPAGAIEPVVDYGHDVGLSVTGGFVYAGTALPALRGRYVFADWGSGRIWSIATEGAPGMREELRSGVQISSFGLDGRGELLAVDYRNGAILRLVP